MNLKEYQEKALGTALPGALSLNYLAPGIAGETGELHEKLYYFNAGMDVSIDDVAHEVADHLWFVALITHMLEIDPDSLIPGDLQLANAAAIFTSVQYTTAILASDLSIHVGNVASAIAKAVRDDDGELSEKRLKQVSESLTLVLMDLLMLGAHLDKTLEDLMEMNLDKLYGRKERGVLGGDGDKR